MTRLLIQTQTVPVMVNLPGIIPMTPAQFSEFCLANRDLRIERTASGEVVIMPPVFSDTGNRNLKIAQQLANWADLDGTGETFDSSTGFTLPNGAIRSPDACWIKLESWNALTEEQKASFAPICPDFVIELRSASDTLSALQDKMQEYLDNGTSLGWLSDAARSWGGSAVLGVSPMSDCRGFPHERLHQEIDRQNRKIYIYRPDQEPEILDNPETVSGAPELMGFVLKMSKIW
ncbi:Uma2 family endonuclease [Moorena producens JHB]|uniref:Uma2 family endonuclease n=1 Tax=Moorena producens (strain JHB) TaxID=1454205 RepID=A0A1D9FZ84_MOOP1|nr:Uma2 family endonuclease [Moorena producens]AOY80595.1 Uma2 family endonuclease [Moorena producens JHB]